jgi:hypothetical protein
MINNSVKKYYMRKEIYFAGIIVIAGAGVGLIAGCSTPPHSLGTSPITVYGVPAAGSGAVNPCPGSYIGYAGYIPTNAWGWTPATGTTTFTAANGGGCSNIKIQFQGEYGDSGCNSSSVTIPNPPPSPSYQFTVYFGSNPVPTTNYPIILTGFNPE